MSKAVVYQIWAEHSYKCSFYVTIDNSWNAIFFSRHNEKGKGDGVHRWTKTVLTTVDVWVTVMVRLKMIVLIGSGTLVSTSCERREKNQRLIPRKTKIGNPFNRWFSTLSWTDEATAVDGSLFNRDSSNVVLSGAAVVSTLPKCQITVHQSRASNLDVIDKFWRVKTLLT